MSPLLPLWACTAALAAVGALATVLRAHRGAWLSAATSLFATATWCAGIATGARALELPLSSDFGTVMALLVLASSAEAMAAITLVARACTATSRPDGPAQRSSASRSSLQSST